MNEEKHEESEETIRDRRALDENPKYPETRFYQVAPISTDLILSYVAKHVLKPPRSF